MVIKKKRNALYLCIVLLLVFAFVNLFPVTSLLAGEKTLNFDETNVLEDLQSSTVNGQPFDIKNYPYGNAYELKILGFVEYCYSFKINMRSNYGLYLYIYNPQNLNLRTDSKANRVQLAVSYAEDGTPNDYEMFLLEFCSKSDGNYKNLFYKFKVIDHKSADGKYIADRVNSNERRYDISGVELLKVGATLPNDYKIGATYTFAGYAAGYGADENAPNTLTCDVNELETIELDVHNTFYRSNSSARGKYYYNELNSVYFGVPDSVLKKYGKLQKIKAEWYEYKTAPMFFTRNKKLYDTALPYIGKGVSTDPGFAIYIGKQSDAGDFLYKYPYLKDQIYDRDHISNSIDNLVYLFDVDGDIHKDYNFSGSRLLRYMENYTKSYIKGKEIIFDREFSADLFADTVDEGRTRGYNVKEIDSDDKFDMLSYDNNHNWWQKLNDYGFFAPDTSGDFKDVSPIYQITENDMTLSDSNISSSLFVANDDVFDLKSFYDNGKKAKEPYTTFLFRFAQTDFFFAGGSYGDVFVSYGIQPITEDYNTYLAQETIFLNFQVLQLTFNRDGVYHVIPVVSDPIDIVNGITIPGVKDPWSWLWLLLMIVALIFLLLILAPVLPYIIRFVIWLVCLPFHAIALVIRAFKGRKRNTEKHKKKE